MLYAPAGKTLLSKSDLTAARRSPDDPIRQVLAWLGVNENSLTCFGEGFVFGIGADREGEGEKGREGKERKV